MSMLAKFQNQWHFCEGRLDDWSKNRSRCIMVLSCAMRPAISSVVAILLGLTVCPRAADAQTPGQVDFFEKRVRPVLANNCYGCHSLQAPEPLSGLRLDSREALLKGGDRGPAIVPGDPSRSRLIQAVRHQTLMMPPNGELAETEIADLEHWVEMGAPWPESAAATPLAAAKRNLSQDGQHWAFQPYAAVPPPDVHDDDWTVTPIDRFVLSRMRAAGVPPSERASPGTLLRRLSYDLNGLPPSLEEIQAFSEGNSSVAYEHAVDRLLRSPHFGERWARHWLDVARYAEAGYSNVRFAFAYTYRDWVIRALNEDMPYDLFVIRQLAADHLPGDEKRHLAALGFLTLGVNPFRRVNLPDKIDDRIDVVTRGLLGLSVSCARCHDHKFDPIPTEDYYSLYGVFANSEEPFEATPIAVSAGSPGQEALNRFYEQRLQKWQDTLLQFKLERIAEHLEDARKAENLQRYLLAAWQGRELTSPQLENLSKERNLNFYLLERWRRYLLRAAEEEDPNFALWTRLASAAEGDLVRVLYELLAAKRQDGHSSLGNPLVVAAFRASPPLSMEEVASRFAEVLASADAREPHADPDREALRLVLRGEESAPNILLEDFWKVQTEGDSNTVNSLTGSYQAVVADYAYRVAPPHAMGLRDAGTMTPSYIFRRGNQNDLGSEVPRRFLAVLSGPERRPFSQGSGRLELARAIAGERNPIFARVIVNRVWHHLFGRGLVETPSDFGTRGAAPTHPELLDFLAATFVEDGWSIKKLIRRIVLSNVYQQSSAGRAEAHSIDPQNDLLWRANRRRLDFEAVRDSMLATAGRLDPRVGGRSFLLGAIPSVPRRTLYSFIERERSLPGFRNFDVADPEQHTPRRHLTTVPQQALFMMNSSFVAEQARHVVNRLKTETDESPEQRVQAIHGRLFGRRATPREVELGLSFVGKTESTITEAQSQAPEPPPSSAWRYGFGELDLSAGRVKSFVPFEYFASLLSVGFNDGLLDAWKPSSVLPDVETGDVHLTAKGGAPGDNPRHSVIRRWVSPVGGKVNISGTLNHDIDQFAERFNPSNGIRAWIVSNRTGTLAGWTLRDLEARTALSRLPVERGEILDFVVDSRGDYEGDSFSWAPIIEEALDENAAETGQKLRRWSAEEDFRGPVPTRLGPWEQYVQVLFETNEFVFLD